jgi:hypothetical protein
MGQPHHLQMIGARLQGASESLDFHPSPPVAVEALCRVEKFDGMIWEPACGNGVISKILEAQGYRVISSDIVDRGYGKGGVDFLKCNPPKVANIVTNPPYNMANSFVEKAIAVTTGKVVMLLRLSWLEGQERHRRIFKHTPPARVWVFSKRIPRMHRDGWTGPKSTSTMPFAWFVWDHATPGPTILGWL